MIIVYDTETTGLAKRDLALDDPAQPRICQIAAALYDDNGREVESFCSLIRPDGWVMEEEALRAHGITLDRCLVEGIGIRDALDTLDDLARRATSGRSVGFNIGFDIRMVNRESSLMGYYLHLRELERYCVMMKCGLGGRWKKLEVVYQTLIGEPMHLKHKAHDALGDVRATAECYFAIQKRAAEAPPIDLKKPAEPRRSKPIF